MKEIELKILELPRSVFLKKMRKLGAKKCYSVFVRIRYFDFPNYRIRKKRDLLRVREFTFLPARNRKTEVVYKTYRGIKKGCKYYDECEFEIEDAGGFKTASAFLKYLGFVQTVSYEKKRTLFSHGRVKFEYDEHPKIPPFLEIEAPSPAHIEKAIRQLGLENHEQTSETISELLRRKYPKLQLNDLRFR